MFPKNTAMYSQQLCQDKDNMFLTPVLSTDYKVTFLKCKKAYQAPQPMGFSRQEYWNGLPFPSPGDLPNPGIETGSPALLADALLAEPPGKSILRML